ncbi:MULTISPECIES: DUF6221 family protein [unclassified Streptomyces]|uniref:DUF6221 family protein n=1 Tax=unclassified Streptomyces TaxID=2593676 RepID=UPI001487CBB3|nr:MULTISPECIES: DUF6221 family protein [unclassified Streptomyces]
MTEDLARWLGEQLDTDERTARAAEGHISELLSWLEISLPAVERHIETHEPARVLREIEAKRQILRGLESAEVALRNTEPGREPHELMTGATNSQRAIVRTLAAVYADRPGYREEWRP